MRTIKEAMGTQSGGATLAVDRGLFPELKTPGQVEVRFKAEIKGSQLNFSVSKYVYDSRFSSPVDYDGGWGVIEIWKQTFDFTPLEPTGGMKGGLIKGSKVVSVAETADEVVVDVSGLSMDAFVDALKAGARQIQYGASSAPGVRRPYNMDSYFKEYKGARMKGRLNDLFQELMKDGRRKDMNALLKKMPFNLFRKEKPNILAHRVGNGKYRVNNVDIKKVSGTELLVELGDDEVRVRRTQESVSLKLLQKHKIRIRLAGQPVAGMAPGGSRAQAMPQPTVAEMAKAIGADEQMKAEESQRVFLEVGDNEDFDVYLPPADRGTGYISVRWVNNRKSAFRGLTYFPKEKGVKRPLRFVDPNRAGVVDLPANIPFYFNVGKAPDSGRYYYVLSKGAYDYFISQICNLTFKNIDLRVVPDEPAVMESAPSTQPATEIKTVKVEALTSPKLMDAFMRLAAAVPVSAGNIRTSLQACLNAITPPERKIVFDQGLEGFFTRFLAEQSAASNKCAFAIRLRGQVITYMVELSMGTDGKEIKITVTDLSRPSGRSIFVKAKEPLPRSMPPQSDTDIIEFAPAKGQEVIPLRRQPTVEEMKKHCGLGTELLWVIYSGRDHHGVRREIVENFVFTSNGMEIAQYATQSPDAKPVYRLTYNMVERKLTYAREEQAEPLVYPEKDFYFNVLKRGDENACVELNESAYRYFKDHGASFDFISISVVVVPDVPDKDWETFVVPQETGKLSEPCGIAVDKEGNIFVVNTRNDTVSVLNPDGRSLNTAFGENGIITKEIGKFDKPKYCALNAAGTLLVTNQGNNTVSAVQKAGGYKRLDTNVGNRDGIIPKSMHGCQVLTGIATDSDSNIILANQEMLAEAERRDLEARGSSYDCTLSLRVLTWNGLATQNTYGHGNGIVTEGLGLADFAEHNINGIYVDTENNIFVPMRYKVTGSDRDRIVVLKPLGKELNPAFGNNGVIQNEYLAVNWPADITRGAAGTIFGANKVVVETVGVWRPDGTLYTDGGLSGNISPTAGCFHRPQGIRASNNGIIIVSNAGNNSLSVVRRAKAPAPSPASGMVLSVSVDSTGVKDIIAGIRTAVSWVMVGGGFVFDNSIGKRPELTEFCKKVSDGVPALPALVLDNIASSRGINGDAFRQRLVIERKRVKDDSILLTLSYEVFIKPAGKTEFVFSEQLSAVNIWCKRTEGQAGQRRELPEQIVSAPRKTDNWIEIDIPRFEPGLFLDALRAAAKEIKVKVGREPAPPFDFERFYVENRETVEKIVQALNDKTGHKDKLRIKDAQGRDGFTVSIEADWHDGGNYVIVNLWSYTGIEYGMPGTLAPIVETNYGLNVAEIRV
ncbi:MAG: NHL repeat-containing protein, partial [Candidatus Omnitrophica bacterium]|nr:NHL repeat-containing protein [Candidatus Omnitrophota bacterium]